jgi:hypothetical protein
MKPYFGLRGTRLNIVISLIAGLDFLYVGIAPVDCNKMLTMLSTACSDMTST